jgi:DNA-binding Lrp family transcriptional regulator
MNDQQHVAISDRDRTVLQLIQATVSMSAADIGKALKLKPHIARRSIERLREQQAVHPYVPINTCALGFTEYQIVLDWGGQSRHADEIPYSKDHGSRPCALCE